MEPLYIATKVGVWLWSKYSKPISDKAIDRLKTEWKKFKWENASRQYRSKIKELNATMYILGNPRRISFEGIFVDVQILKSITAAKRISVEGLCKLCDDRFCLADAQQRQQGMQAVLHSKRLFVWGRPGAGKTTFLKHIALRAASGELEKIPIWVSLRDWADSELTLKQYFVRQFDICSFPDVESFIEYVLRQGHVMVLFDGLDEISVTNGQRSRIIKAITIFLTKYSSVHCIITCRPGTLEYLSELFDYVEMADFTQPQIESFSSKWFEENPQKQVSFLKELMEPENKGLLELAKTPLILTLLCLAFEEMMHFPRRQIEIYDEAIDALLKKWDNSRMIKRDEVYRKLFLGRKRQMFSKIAYETLAGTNKYFIPQAELTRRIDEYLRDLPPADIEEHIEGEAVLRAIEEQHGIFVEQAHHIHSFSHLSVQEYFAAKHIAEKASTGFLQKTIEAHLGDERWDPVFIMTASLLEEGDELLDIMISHSRNTLSKYGVDADDLFKSLQQYARRFKSDQYLVRGFRLAFLMNLSVEVFLSSFRKNEIDYALFDSLTTEFLNKLTIRSDPDLYSLGTTVDAELNYMSKRAGRKVTIGDFVQNLFSIHPLDRIKDAVQQYVNNISQLKLPRGISRNLSYVTGNCINNLEHYERFLLQVVAIAKKRHIPARYLSVRRSSPLPPYHKANLLILECMRVARSPKRQSMLDCLWCL